MILKALYDYYYRIGNLPPYGAELKEIEFVIVIDAGGHFKRFESKRIDKKRCASFIVPKGVGRTSAPKANVLWDNGKYVLGLEDAHQECNRLFIDMISRVASDNPDDTSIQALKSFYERPKDVMLDEMSRDPLFEVVKENLASNFSFQLEGDGELIAEKLYLCREPYDDDCDDVREGVCLITGEHSQLVRTTSATPVPGNSPMAALVGIQVNSGYDSYGKTQAYNAPISKKAEFAYTTALKAMLGKDSGNKIKIGDRVFLFWGSNNTEVSKSVEASFLDYINMDLDKKDDPNEKLGKMEKLMRSIWSGQIQTTLDDRFYILGLAPNTGRIAVVSWDDITLKEFACKILQHFDDMKIADSRRPDKRRPYSGIYSMLSAITLSGKPSDVPPPLVEGTLKAITTGADYPFALYTSALERIRADVKMPISPCRAGILKAYINRVTRLKNNIKPLQPMLDMTNDNPGYLCGRLAAVLEHIQSNTNGGDTIRTTYLTAASATPANVFPSMLTLSIHHSEKLTASSCVFFEKLKQEIVTMLPASGFPARLDLIDQGRFFVGYYHQKYALFNNTKSE